MADDNSLSAARPSDHGTAEPPVGLVAGRRRRHALDQQDAGLHQDNHTVAMPKARPDLLPTPATASTTTDTRSSTTTDTDTDAMDPVILKVLQERSSQPEQEGVESTPNKQQATDEETRPPNRMSTNPVQQVTSTEPSEEDRFLLKVVQQRCQQFAEDQSTTAMPLTSTSTSTSASASSTRPPGAYFRAPGRDSVRADHADYGMIMQEQNNDHGHYSSQQQQQQQQQQRSSNGTSTSTATKTTSTTTMSEPSSEHLVRHHSSDTHKTMKSSPVVPMPKARPNDLLSKTGLALKPVKEDGPTSIVTALPNRATVKAGLRQNAPLPAPAVVEEGEENDQRLQTPDRRSPDLERQTQPQQQPQLAENNHNRNDGYLVEATLVDTPILADDESTTPSPRLLVVAETMPPNETPTTSDRDPRFRRNVYMGLVGVVLVLVGIVAVLVVTNVNSNNQNATMDDTASSAASMNATALPPTSTTSPTPTYKAFGSLEELKKAIASSPSEDLLRGDSAVSLTYGMMDVWNISLLTSLDGVFEEYQGPDFDLKGWDTSRITSMNRVFASSSFLGDITGWNVSSVVSMAHLFANHVFFNQNIGAWQVRRVTDMNSLFLGASSFHQDIGGWNVASVRDMSAVFASAQAFNHNISGWNVSAATTMYSMFSSATAFDTDLSQWDVGSVQAMNWMFMDVTSTLTGLSEWNVASVTDMHAMFFQAQSFNENIAKWNVESAKDMGSMFHGAWNFNQDISRWKVVALENIDKMFYFATSFGQDLCPWNEHFSESGTSLLTSTNFYGETSDGDVFENTNCPETLQPEEDTGPRFSPLCFVCASPATASSAEMETSPPLVPMLGFTVPSNWTTLILTPGSVQGSSRAIGAEVSLLTNLDILAVSGNELTGHIPSEIGMLTKLTHLNFRGNNLIGTLPTELGLLRNVVGIFLDNNNLSGPIPNEISSLTSLKTLRLDHNQLTGTIALSLGNLVTNGLLETVDLANNTFTGTLPAPFCQLEGIDWTHVVSNNC